MRKLYAGGWRDVPAEERWWDKAFDGQFQRNNMQGLRYLAETVGIPVVV